MAYVELHACSAFSFLRGASFPEQLAEVAAELEMPALALLDRNGVYGAQRFSIAAREQKIRAITGCELTMEDGTLLPVLVANRIGYKNLCELLTQAHLCSSVKGECAIRWNRWEYERRRPIGQSKCRDAIVCGTGINVVTGRQVLINQHREVLSNRVSEQ